MNEDHSVHVLWNDQNDRAWLSCSGISKHLSVYLPVTWHINVAYRNNDNVVFLCWVHIK